MRRLRMIPALLLLCLLAACGGPVVPVTTIETTTELASTTMEKNAGPTTQMPSKLSAATRLVPNDLLDFTLIDRLFSMTYADFCREEGHTVEPDGTYEGGRYYSFSKYNSSDAYFFFDEYDTNLLTVMAMDTPDILVRQQTLTLGECKQWLDKNEIAYSMHDYEGITCDFFAKNYFISAVMDEANDDAVVRRFAIYLKSNIE